MYDIHNLTFQYALSSQPSLSDVSLHLESGKIHLVMGPSGSGKTTLLRHLKKELLPKGERSGSVTYQHELIQQVPGEQSVTEIGYLFQDPSNQIVMDHVWHEIAFGLENMGMPYKQMKRRVAEMIHYFDLQDIYNQETETLSGGQKQIVNLAALMVMHPKVLVLDEPTAQLDPVSRQHFWSIIKKLHDEFQLTIIMTSHQLENVLEMADNCIFMRNGAVRFQGLPKDAITYLWEEKDTMRLSLPQILRICEMFHLSPTFSITKLKEQLKHRNYEVMKKINLESRKDVLCCNRIFAGYEGEHVIKDLTLSLKEKEFFAIVGSNGSGKSTFLNCITKRMYYRGKIETKRKVIYLPQDPTVLFVKDNLFEDLMTMGKDLEYEILSWLKICDLVEQKDMHPYDLSGGQRQMAALIKVLLANPEVLLLDEPTKGMDREHVVAFGNIIRSLLKQGLSVLCVSHDLEFCAQFADRIGIMFDGAVEGIGTPEDFFLENYFYTTDTAKITGELEKSAILPESMRCL